MARDIVETVKVFDEGADPHEFSVRLTYARKLLEEDSGPAGLEEIPLIDRNIDEADVVIVDGSVVKELDSGQDEPLESGEESSDESDKTALIPSDGSGVPIPSEFKHTSSLAGASFNFINSIIGAGIIGIPSALHEAGFGVGVVLLTLVALMTDYTVLLLIKDGIIAGKFTYQEMVTVAFGRPGYVFLTIAQFLFPFFAMSGYIVITGDTFSRILSELFTIANRDPIPALVDQRLIKVVMVMVVMLPLSLLRNISRLEKFSALAILFITFIVSVTIYEATQLFCAVRCIQPECCDSPVTTWVVNKDVIQSIGIMAFAFVCHHNTYLIYASLDQRSLTRFAKVTHTSVSISFVFCLILGLSGFLTFLQVTEGDLLNNYCIKDPVANFTRFFYACVIMLTYPIECFVTREVLEIGLSRLPYKIISWIPISRLRKALDHFLYAPRHKSLSRHIILTLLLVLGTLVIGVSTNDLAVVLAFTGCFTATPLAFILPTASFLKLSHGRWCSREKIIAMAVMIFGIIVMFIGTGLAIVQAVKSYANSENSLLTEPVYCIRNETCQNLLSVPLCDCRQFSNSSVTWDESMNITCDSLV